VHANALPLWALAASAFAAGAIATWCAARAAMRQRMVEVETARQRLERDVRAITRLEQSRNELYAEHVHSQKLEALGTLAGSVAHDLNDALVPILTLSK